MNSTSDQYNETLARTVYCSLKLYCAKHNIPGWNGFTPVRLNRYSPELKCITMMIV